MNEENLLGVVELNVSSEGSMEDALEKMRQESMSLWITRDMPERMGEWPDLQATRQNAMPLAIAVHELVINMKEDQPDLESIATLLLLCTELKTMAAVHFVRQVVAGHGPELSFDEPQQPEEGTP